MSESTSSISQSGSAPQIPETPKKPEEPKLKRVSITENQLIAGPDNLPPAASNTMKKIDDLANPPFISTSTVALPVSSTFTGAHPVSRGSLAVPTEHSWQRRFKEPRLSLILQEKIRELIKPPSEQMPRVEQPFQFKGEEADFNSLLRDVNEQKLIGEIENILDHYPDSLRIGRLLAMLIEKGKYEAAGRVATRIASRENLKPIMNDLVFAFSILLEKGAKDRSPRLAQLFFRLLPYVNLKEVPQGNDQLKQFIATLKHEYENAEIAIDPETLKRTWDILNKNFPGPDGAGRCFFNAVPFKTSFEKFEEFGPDEQEILSGKYKEENLNLESAFGGQMKILLNPEKFVDDHLKSVCMSPKMFKEISAFLSLCNWRDGSIGPAMEDNFRRGEEYNKDFTTIPEESMKNAIREFLIKNPQDSSLWNSYITEMLLTSMRPEERLELLSHWTSRPEWVQHHTIKDCGDEHNYYSSLVDTLRLMHKGEGNILPQSLQDVEDMPLTQYCQEYSPASYELFESRFDDLCVKLKYKMVEDDYFYTNIESYMHVSYTSPQSFLDVSKFLGELHNKNDAVGAAVDKLFAKPEVEKEIGAYLAKNRNSEAVRNSYLAQRFIQRFPNFKFAP
jgi:hypothetical protein